LFFQRKLREIDSYDPDKPITISCRLIPVSQAVTFAVVLILLSTTSWIIAPASSGFMAFGILLQMLIIPIVIGSALTLKVEVSRHGLNPRSQLHRDSLYSYNAKRWEDLHSVRLRKLKSPALLLSRLREANQSRLQKRSALVRLFDAMTERWAQQGFLLLDFRSGGLAAFPLAGFSAQMLEDLFLAISRFANPMSLNPEVIALQNNILTGQELKLGDTYTEMWEQSLRRNFELTNFVPLMGGQELRDGQIKILMLLACGGFSSVYLARDKAGKRLIVKELSVPEDGNPEALSKIHEMFAREARILSRLDHPNIVAVLDHFVENSRDYLLLEYIPGLTLRQHVHMNGAFNEKEVTEIARQLANILSYLHQFDPPIIHRDLTPDNLIISEPDRRITLVDFGAANEFVNRMTGTLIGKQCYIAPEQLRGRAETASDIYAAGATIHYLLVGNDPEPISCSHPRTQNPAVSPEMDELVAAATATEVEDRISNAQTLLEKVDSLSRARIGGR
jgi:tRNA A-37 threonylcarbamoyl transferase component Bud32